VSSGRTRTGRLAFDQALAQTAPQAESPLEPSHLAIVTLVIIAKEVQEAVEGEDPEFGGQAVPGGGRLALRNAKRNHDIAEIPRLISRKGQDVGRCVFLPVSAIQLAHATVGHHGNGDRTPDARRRDRLEPTGQAGRPDPLGQDHRDTQA
jgi:hypothetical protein